MKTKETKTINFCIDESIKVGDNVRFIDGSALTCEESNDNVYIVCDYPDLTNSPLTIKELVFKVKEIGINDKIATTIHDWCYLQDIIVSYNGVDFRTASKFVAKVN